jgi:hypothetical protein
MANLLVDQELLTSNSNGPDNPARSLARARTLWTLWQVDANRKRNILEFLYDGGLITRDPNLDDKGIVELHGANFINGYFRDIELPSVALDGADLKGADLRNATLTKAHLGGADLDQTGQTAVRLVCSRECRATPPRERAAPTKHPPSARHS